MLSSLPSTLAVVAGVAEGLQVSELQRRTAPVDRNDVINHLRRRVPGVFQALLAQGLLLQLDYAKFPPRRRLVELRVGMNPSCMRRMFRLPRPADGFLERRHDQKTISGFSGRS